MAAGSFARTAGKLDKDTSSPVNIYPGVYVGIVKDNADVGQRSGRLKVHIPEFLGEEENPNSWIIVNYASPFYGVSPHEPPKSDGESQLPPVTTYGFWAIPPDIGVRVLCTFIKGEPTLGYWFAVIPGLSHGMVPAAGAPDGKTPVMDVNPYDPKNNKDADIAKLQRQPFEALTKQFTTQGLAEDPIRGPITSSSFRESPSRVFGISSQSTPEAPGHSFVMDDGGEDGTNKLIRIRTSSGNQITMNDDTGMIYLINAGGTGWVEISPSGQIDVYGEKGINMATPGDINFHADNDINLHANNCIKIVASNGAKIQGNAELQLHGAKTMIEGVDSLHIHSCTEMMFTSYADIHMKAFNYFCLKGKCFYWNSCTAKEAEQVPPEQPEELSGYQTTVARAPSKEPYKEHDNGQSGGAGGGGAGTDAAPDGSASGTGPGGMFDGNTGGSTGAAMDTAATSLGSSNFSLGFRTGLAGNRIGTGSNNWGTGAGQTQARDASVSTRTLNPTGSSMGASGSFGNPNVSGSTFVDYTAANNARLQNATRTTVAASSLQSGSTGVPTTAQPVATNSTTTYQYRPPTTTQVGPMSTPVTATGSLTATQTTLSNEQLTAGSALSGSFTTNYASQPPSTTTQTLTQQNAVQSPDAFTSQNPADQAATGRTSPAQDASGALDQISGQNPSSDLPAAPGGGGTGCFATGDNCERPADETGGGGGGDLGGPAPEPLSPEEINQIDKEVYDQLRAEGLSPEDAAAVTARWKMESGNWAYTNRFGDLDGKSYGIAQWRGDRYNALIRSCGSTPSRSCQVKFGVNESQMKKTLQANKSASTMWQRTENVRRIYEGAKSISRNDSLVHANANNFLSNFKQ